MTIVWKPFEESTRLAIVEAERASESFGSRVIGNEHLILGVLAAPENLGGIVLKAFGVTTESARDVLRALSDLRPHSPDDQLVFTPDAKQTIEDAFTEARKLDHHSITTAHILLAIAAASPKGNPISELGIDANVLRDRLLAAILQREAPAPIATEPGAETIVTRIIIPKGGEEKARWFYLTVLGLAATSVRFRETADFSAAHVPFEINSRDRSALVARIRAANFDVDESAGEAYAIARDPFGNTIDLM